MQTQRSNSIETFQESVSKDMRILESIDLESIGFLNQQKEELEVAGKYGESIIKKIFEKSPTKVNNLSPSQVINSVNVLGINLSAEERKTLEILQKAASLGLTKKDIFQDKWNEMISSAIESAERNKSFSKEATGLYVGTLAMRSDGASPEEINNQPSIRLQQKTLGKKESGEVAAYAEDQYKRDAEQAKEGTLSERTLDFIKENKSTLLGVSLVLIGAYGVHKALFKNKQNKKWGLGLASMAAIGAGVMLNKEHVEKFIEDKFGVSAKNIKEFINNSKDKGLAGNAGFVTGMMGVFAAMNKGDNEEAIKQAQVMAENTTVVKQGKASLAAAESGRIKTDVKTPGVEAPQGKHLERAQEKLSEDLNEVFAGMREALGNIEGVNAIIDKHQAAYETLWNDPDTFDVVKYAYMPVYKMDLAKDLITHLVQNEQMSMTFEAGKVVVISGGKMITHSALNAMSEAFGAAFTEKSAEEAFYSYVSETSGLIVISATTIGAYSAIRTLSLKGGLVGGMKAAAKAAVLPLYATKVAWQGGTSAAYHMRHFEDYSKITLDHARRMNEFVKYHAKKFGSKRILNSGVQARAIEALQEEYGSMVATMLDRKIYYLESMRNTKKGKIPFLEERAINAKIDKLKAKLNKLEVGPTKRLAALLERKEFKNVPEEVKNYLQRKRGSLIPIITRIAQEPDSKYAQIMLSDKRLLEQLVEDYSLRLEFESKGMVARFDSPGFAEELERILKENPDDIELRNKLFEFSNEGVVKGKGVEHLINSNEKIQGRLKEFNDVAATAINENLKQTERLQKEMVSAFEAAKKADPSLTLKAFKQSPAALAITKQIQEIQQTNVQIGKAFAQDLARELSGGTIDDIKKLPKPQRKIAFDFIKNTAEWEIPWQAMAKEKIVKITGTHVIIAAPVLALRMYMNEDKNKLGDELTSAGIALTPVLGTAADFYAAIQGKDYFTGEDIERADALKWAIVGTGLDIAAIFGGAGIAGRMLLKGAKAGKKIPKVLQTGARVLDKVSESAFVTKTGKLAGATALGMMTTTIAGATFEMVTSFEEVASFDTEDSSTS